MNHHDNVRSHQKSEDEFKTDLDLGKALLAAQGQPLHLKDRPRREGGDRRIEDRRGTSPYLVPPGPDLTALREINLVRELRTGRIWITASIACNLIFLIGVCFYAMFK